MGCYQSRDSNGIQHTQNKTIKDEVSILLLGISESGKSTIVKQMKVIHLKGYSLSERIDLRSVIYHSIAKTIYLYLTRMSESMTECSTELESLFEQVSNLHDGTLLSLCNKDFDDGLLDETRDILGNMYLMKLLEASNDVQTLKFVKHFQGQKEKVCSSGYIPSVDDILQVRIPTTGIVEMQFQYRNLMFKMYDVGGQRSERRKWIHFFEGINALIFVVDLSSYDSTIQEDSKANAMLESLMVFKSVCQTKWFAKSSVILFLNKTDLFEEKLRMVCLNVCFPEYNGSQSFEEAGSFIKKKFEMAFRSQNTNDIYSFFTCATDTNGMQKIFKAAADLTLRKNLREVGLM